MANMANQLLSGIRLSRYQLGLASASLLLFLLLALYVKHTSVPDDFILKESLKWENQQVTQLMRFITFLGNHQFLIPANILLICFLIAKQEKKAAWLVLFTALSSLGWKFLLKELFSRPRPVEAMIIGIKNYSFPSGHALISLTFYGLLMLIACRYIISKKTRHLVVFLFSALILLIGFSRIYLRVHYTTDVVAGYMFGYGWLILCIYIFTKLKAYTQIYV